MTGYLVVFFGAGVGGMLRHATNLASFRFFGPDLPIATLTVNVVGSVLIGLVAGHFALSADTDSTQRLFLTTGLLGGFTTFSAFSLEAALLWQRSQIAGCVLYVTASVVLSIAGVFAGLAIARA